MPADPKAPLDALIGQSIGKHRIVRQIGRGGMGAVFEAVHESIGQRAAIKVLLRDSAQDPKAVQRFFDEARAVNIVQHEGLVQVYDYGQLDDGTIYILMEYLHGESLWARMSQLRDSGRRLALLPSLRIAQQLAAALDAVHKKGIVHRDLKPENVVLVQDPAVPGGERAKIVDFGVAKFREESGSERRTTDGRLLGTPTYMAPEQCRESAQVDDRADVYSLGVLLYEMLAGRPPFQAKGIGNMMVLHMLNPPPPLVDVARPQQVPREVHELVHRMLSKEPAERPNMEQAEHALATLSADAAQAGGLISVERERPLIVANGTRRWRLLSIIAVALFLMFGGGVWRLLKKENIPPVAPPHLPVAPPSPSRTADLAVIPDLSPTRPEDAGIDPRMDLALPAPDMPLPTPPRTRPVARPPARGVQSQTPITAPAKPPPRTERPDDDADVPYLHD